VQRTRGRCRVAFRNCWCLLSFDLGERQKSRSQYHDPQLFSLHPARSGCPILGTASSRQGWDSTYPNPARGKHPQPNPLSSFDFAERRTPSAKSRDPRLLSLSRPIPFLQNAEAEPRLKSQERDRGTLNSWANQLPRHPDHPRSLDPGPWRTRARGRKSASVGGSYFPPPVCPRPSRDSLPLNFEGSLRCAAGFSPTLGAGPL
jgi:hypothetical protein